MKFGYNAEGNVVPIESIRLTESIADLDAKLNALAPESRPLNVAKVQELLQESGEAPSEDDENVFALYKDGLLEFTSVEQYFGARLQRAVLRRFGGGENGAA